jgi:hypothetical protein
MTFANAMRFSLMALAASFTLARASPLSGTFDIAGTLVATPTTNSWIGLTGTPNQATIGTTGLSGSFVGLGGTTVTIQMLNEATEPVDGSGFAPTLFISFDAAPQLGTLEISYIYPGIYSAAGCAATPPAVGQTCTPNTGFGTPGPFNFVNNPPPSLPESTATFVFAGITSAGGVSNTWDGNFTSQFNVPFQTVLAQLSANGSVTNSYSASFSVSTVPEPGTVVMTLTGLALLGLSRLRRKIS